MSTNKRNHYSGFSGRHVIEVTYAGRPINGSPFYVDVYDPARVIIDGLRDSEVNNETGFDGQSF